MPQFPLLFFPEPTEAARNRLGGGGGRILKPTPAQQRDRLDAKFRRIAQSFVGIQGDVQGLEPEQLVVLETIGDRVEGLARAAAQVPGMEWLAELDVDAVPP